MSEFRTCSIFSLLFAIASFALIPRPGHAQQETMRPVPVQPTMEMVPAPPPTAVATAPSGGWILVRGDEYRASNVPNELEEKLREFTRDGTTVDEVAFTPAGGWTLIAGEKDWTRGVGGDYFDTLMRLRDDGQGIRAVAFNPVGWEENHGFVIVHDEGFVAEHVPEELRQRLRSFLEDGHAVQDVAFTPDGGWTIVTDEGNWTRNVGGPDPSYFDTVMERLKEGQEVEAVSFFHPGYADARGWLVVTKAEFEGAAVPEGLARALREATGRTGEVHDRSRTRTAAARGAPGSDEDGTDRPTPVGWHLSGAEPVYVVELAAGDRTRRLDLRDEPMAGLRIGENNNRPCAVTIWGISGRTMGVKCRKGSEHGNKRMRVNLDDHAVRSLNTCRPSGANVFTRIGRVKGVALEGNLIRSDGSFDEAEATDRYDLANCAEWYEEKAICPARHVASGVIAHFDKRGRQRQDLTGFELICREVEVEYSSR